MEIPSSGSAASARTRAQFANFVAETKAKRAAEAAKRPAKAVLPPKMQPLDIEAVRIELRLLEARFDSSYQFSEDRTVYQKGAEKAARIDHLRRVIADADRKAA